MKNPDDELSEKHISDLRVAYLENLLTPAEMSAVEKHIQKCAECRADLEDLKHWENTLRTNKDSMCPEPWELFDYVRGGADPAGKMKAHVGECALCRNDAAAFAVEPHETSLPPELWQRIAALSTDRDMEDRPPHEETFLSKMAAAWSWFFRIPMLATAAVAAVVLMVVLMYPTGRDLQPVVGLSSVQWGVKLMRPGPMPSIPKAVVPKKNRLAMIIFFEGFPKAPSQQRIDSLYRSLKPTSGLLRQYNVVPPLEVKQTAVESHVGVLNRDNLVKVLYEKLGVNRVVLLVIHKHGALFDIDAELMDSADLKTLRSLGVRSLSEENLVSKLKDTTLSVLEVR